MSLLKEYQTVLEHNFRFIKNSQATWPEISAWLCSVKQTSSFKMVQAFIKGEGNLKKLTCNFCGKEGHWESKCRLKKNQTSGKNDTRGKPDTKKNSSFEKNEPGGKKENLNSKAEGQTQNKCSHCGNSNHTSDRCWKK